MIELLGVLLFVVPIGVWIGRRRSRADRLSGTTAAAPVFSVEPPRRRVSPLKGERL